MNSISEIVEEFNALEEQRAELEENKILQVLWWILKIDFYYFFVCDDDIGLLLSVFVYS